MQISAIFSALILALCLPILGSYYYAHPRDLVWLLSALSGLGAALAMVALVVSLPRRQGWRIMLTMLTLELLAALQLARFVSFYFQGESFNQRFFFHFNLSSLTEAGSAYLPLIIISLLYILAIAMLAFAWSSSRPDGVATAGNHYPRLLTFSLLALLLVADPDVRRLAQAGLVMVQKQENELSQDSLPWQQLGLNPAALTRQVAGVKPGKNLVLIYLESLESLYLDERIFPGLMPNLNRLKEQGLSFTNLEQVEGADWTMGGIVSSQCGTPLIYGFGPSGNDVLQNGFLGRATCLGDVLRAAGYRQVYLNGASTQFAGQGRFLRDHGYDEVNGHEELLPQIKDPAYLNGWGLYDDSLFAIAEVYYTRLAQSQQPFNLTLLTIDTHPPTGNASVSCPAYQARDNEMLDAVHCTDYLVGRFIERLRQTPVWNDTVVALCSDHLAMRNIAQPYYPEGYPRKLFFTVLNADNQGQVPVAASHLDLAPTLLTLLGVEHRQAFLAGRDLLGGETLPEFRQAPISHEAAFRFINSKLLSDSSKSLCQQSHLLRVADRRLYLAGEEVSLSISGQPVDIEQFAEDLAFVALLNQEGGINSTIVAKAINLGHILYQFREWPFVALVRANDVPAFLELNLPGEGLVVLLGSLRGEVESLATLPSLSALHLTLEDCQKRFDEVRGRSGGEPISLNALCRDPSPATTVIDPDTEAIEMRQVAVGNEWYRGRLEKTAPGSYKLVEYSFLGQIKGDSLARNGVCHAYFGNDELIIPHISTGKNKQAMLLRRVAKSDWEFEVVESVSL